MLPWSEQPCYTEGSIVFGNENKVQDYVVIFFRLQKEKGGLFNSPVPPCSSGLYQCPSLKHKEQVSHTFSCVYRRTLSPLQRECCLSVGFIRITPTDVRAVLQSIKQLIRFCRPEVEFTRRSNACFLGHNWSYFSYWLLTLWISRLKSQGVWRVNLFDHLSWNERTCVS